MSEKKGKRGLGRGLSALMADVGSPGAAEDPSAGVRGTQTLAIDRIQPNPSQPRKRFDSEALADLAVSIRAKGVLQPLIVRPADDGMFEIVAGERRWRAAQMAQIHEVPVIVGAFDDVEVLEIAIIENIQRSDLSPLEEAEGFRQLIDRFNHTQEKLATALGKSRSHIANTLRLLSLPADVQDMLRNGQLTAGHARALITAANPSELARQIVERSLTVREAEALARTGDSAKRRPRRKTSSAYDNEKDADTKALEQDLSANLRMSVVIDHRPSEGGGQVIIRYKTLDDLDQLCQILSQVR